MTLQYEDCFQPLNFFIDVDQYTFHGKGRLISKGPCSYEVTVPFDSFEQKTILFENYENVFFSVSTHLEEEDEKGNCGRVEHSFNNKPSRYRVEFINDQYQKCTVCWADQQEFDDDICPQPHPSRQVYDLCTGTLEEECQLRGGRFADTNPKFVNKIQYNGDGEITDLFHVCYGLFYGQENARHHKRVSIPFDQIQTVAYSRGFGSNELFPSIDKVLLPLFLQRSSKQP